MLPCSLPTWTPNADILVRNLPRPHLGPPRMPASCPRLEHVCPWSLTCKACPTELKCWLRVNYCSKYIFESLYQINHDMREVIIWKCFILSLIEQLLCIFHDLFKEAKIWVVPHVTMFISDVNPARGRLVRRSCHVLASRSTRDCAWRASPSCLNRNADWDLTIVHYIDIWVPVPNK
jgi:hypothetical protein